MSTLAQAGQPLLSVDNLEVSFGSGPDAVKVVEDVSFEIRPGERVAMVGESGSGKSMVAMSVIGLLPKPGGRVSAGRITFEGQDLTELSTKEMRRVQGARIAMVFQDAMTSLNPLMTIGFHLMEPLMRHKGMSRRDARSRAVELLDMVRIPRAAESLTSYPHEFSGGMRQRVMIAAGMSCDPSLIIADEPTTALDVTVQAEVLQLLRQLSEETSTSVLFITHDMGIVSEFADRVVVMYAGRVVEVTTTAELFGRGGAHPYSVDLVASVPRVDTPRSGRLQAIPGQLPPPGSRAVGCAYASRCSRRLERCATDLPPPFPTATGGLAACWLQEPGA